MNLNMPSSVCVLSDPVRVAIDKFVVSLPYDGQTHALNIMLAQLPGSVRQDFDPSNPVSEKHRSLHLGRLPEHAFPKSVDELPLDVRATHVARKLLGESLFNQIDPKRVEASDVLARLQQAASALPKDAPKIAGPSAWSMKTSIPEAVIRAEIQSGSMNRLEGFFQIMHATASIGASLDHSDLSKITGKQRDPLTAKNHMANSISEMAEFYFRLSEDFGIDPNKFDSNAAIARGLATDPKSLGHHLSWLILAGVDASAMNVNQIEAGKKFYENKGIDVLRLEILALSPIEPVQMMQKIQEACGASHPKSVEHEFAKDLYRLFVQERQSNAPKYTVDPESVKSLGSAQSAVSSSAMAALRTLGCDQQKTSPNRPTSIKQHP